MRPSMSLHSTTKDEAQGVGVARLARQRTKKRTLCRLHSLLGHGAFESMFENALRLRKAI